MIILFVIFFVLNNPGLAGSQTRDFFGWIADMAGQVATFFDGLFSDDVPGVNGTTPTPTATTVAADGSGSNSDSFSSIGSILNDSVAI